MTDYRKEIRERIYENLPFGPSKRRGNPDGDERKELLEKLVFHMATAVAGMGEIIKMEAERLKQPLPYIERMYQQQRNIIDPLWDLAILGETPSPKKLRKVLEY